MFYIRFCVFSVGFNMCVCVVMRYIYIYIYIYTQYIYIYMFVCVYISLLLMWARSGPYGPSPYMGPGPYGPEPIRARARALRYGENC